MSKFEAIQFLREATQADSEDGSMPELSPDQEAAVVAAVQRLAGNEAARQRSDAWRRLSEIGWLIVLPPAATALLGVAVIWVLMGFRRDSPDA